MIKFFLSKMMGSQSERTLKRFQPTVDKINALEKEIALLSDDELRAKTDEFKAHIKVRSSEFAETMQALVQHLDEVALPEEKQKVRVKMKDLVNSNILEDILPEAFAVVREAARRTIGLRHHDVQLAGGLTLHYGMIAEMANGEGKTLVATLAAYLNALGGKGVHVVTVNDYLAGRDRDWMGPVYEFLGLRVGAIQHDMGDEQRQYAYNCDITYGTNNEFGFDYLRDNMKFRKESMVQREFNYAVVDEVDSILIDEARTPLIISGPTEGATDKYYKADKIARKLKGKKITDKEEIEAKHQEKDLTVGFDFIIKEKEHVVFLTEEGEKRAASLWGVDSLNTIDMMPLKHLTQQALRAHNLFQRDVDYILKGKEVVIVDEFTGRLMPGRRWSDGLHQAIEAKEDAKIERENQTLATVTFQNYFRMYEKLSGMTGTGSTEAQEFHHIYKLEIITIPTNKTALRQDLPDVIYKTEREKFKSVVDEVVENHKKGRPVLVGTISIEKSEHLGELLKLRGIPRNVLNAKYHESEAHIVAQAGRLGAVTIATNMAGRGTDIRLGGNLEFMVDDMLRQMKVGPKDANYEEERKKLFSEFGPKISDESERVMDLGGLCVLGTERHESRRIDNQLRGRSGRQGVSGSSRFYLSLEDDLMRIFASDRISQIMDFFKWEESTPIEHPLITRSIETAQKRVETHNFEIRKQLLQYDNVMNRQREVIYDERRFILENSNLKSYALEIIDETADSLLDLYVNAQVHPDEWNLVGLKNHLKSKFHLEATGINTDLSPDEIRKMITKAFEAAYQNKETSFGAEKLEGLTRMLLLQIMDAKWKDHLYSMDFLREGIGLRGYGGHDPLVEYQREGFDMFSQMMSSIKDEALEFIFKIQPAKEEKTSGVFAKIPQQFLHPESKRLQDMPGKSPKAPASPASNESLRPFKRELPKVGRNEPCPCGSGKKYKKCCGKDAA